MRWIYIRPFLTSARFLRMGVGALARGHARLPDLRPSSWVSLRLAAGLSCLLGTLAVAASATPGDGTSPWDHYNAGIRAYAAAEYERARATWTDLSLAPLPRGLRHPVWFQLANAQYRLGEQQLAEAPEQAAELWRRSREAARTALALKPRDSATRHNLTLVEKRLAALLHRLGLETFETANDKPRDDALALLRPAIGQLEEAVSLAPADVTIRRDRDRVLWTLRQTLVGRAADAERRGDEDAKQASAWSDRQAAERFQDALEDLSEAGRPTTAAEPSSTPSLSRAPGEDDPLNQAIAESLDRIKRKLADLLARMGQREQKEGMAARDWGPDEALDHFEAALNWFLEAQAEQPGHELAERGEREVRKAMEQLRVREGLASLQQGKERLERREAQAASSLTTALDHFEAALALNANSVPAQNGAEEARRLLPEALVLAGQAAQQAGDRAEPGDPGEALTQYREAETDFQQALDLEPGQPQAQQGLDAVRVKMARMQERLAQEAQGASPPSRRTPTLEGLLDQVTEREPPPESDRQRQRARNRPGDRRIAQDW